MGYNLSIKSGMWEKTEELICEIKHAWLIATATKIKEINQYIDINILVLKQYVQILAAYAFHSYAYYF